MRTGTNQISDIGHRGRLAELTFTFKHTFSKILTGKATREEKKANLLSNGSTKYKRPAHYTTVTAAYVQDRTGRGPRGEKIITFGGKSNLTLTNS